MNARDKRELLEALAPVGVTKIVSHRNGTLTISFKTWIDASLLPNVYYSMTDLLYKAFGTGYRVVRAPMLDNACRTMIIRLVDTVSLDGLNAFLSALNTLSQCVDPSHDFNSALTDLYVFNAPVSDVTPMCETGEFYVYLKRDVNCHPAYSVCGGKSDLYEHASGQLQILKVINGVLYGVVCTETKNLRIVTIDPFSSVHSQFKDDVIQYNFSVVASHLQFSASVAINQDATITLSPIVLNDYVYVTTKLNDSTFTLKWVRDIADLSDTIMMVGMQIGEATWYYLDKALDNL